MSKSKAGVDQNWKDLIKSNPQLLKSKKKKITKNGGLTRKQTSEQKSNDTKNEIWFDGVDQIHLTPETSSSSRSTVDKGSKSNGLVKENSFKGLTRVIAMDCEMVGVEDGDESILARVSIVNQFGQCVYDKYVKPKEEVTNYRTEVSGIRPSDLANGEDFGLVQREVSEILHKRILVGHAVHNDLKVLFLSHPRRDLRDTSRYKPFVRLFNGKTPSLKNLTHRLLGIQVQTGEHDSIEDAQATMRLYTMHRKEWEAQLTSRKHPNKKTVEKVKRK